MGLLQSCVDIITLIRLACLNSLRVSMNLGIFFDIFMRVNFNLNRCGGFLLHIADSICRHMYLGRGCMTGLRFFLNLMFSSTYFMCGRLNILITSVEMSRVCHRGLRRNQLSVLVVGK